MENTIKSSIDSMVKSMADMFKVWVDILKKKACGHKWKVYHRTDVYNPKRNNPKKDFPVERYHTMVCKKCGEFKRIRV